MWWADGFRATCEAIYPLLHREVRARDAVGLEQLIAEEDERIAAAEERERQRSEWMRSEPR